MAGLHRRRQASQRMVPLDCACGPEPWVCRCWDNPEPSERMVDAYRDTVLHLRHCGLLAAPRLREMRVLWRRGGRDRRLVSAIAERWAA